MMFATSHPQVIIYLKLKNTNKRKRKILFKCKVYIKKAMGRLIGF